MSASKNEQKTRGTPFKPGNPGGPGRPAGSRNAATLLLDKIADDAGENILRKMVEAAEGGDMRAGELVLSRIWPARKGRPISHGAGRTKLRWPHGEWRIGVRKGHLRAKVPSVGESWPTKLFAPDRLGLQRLSPDCGLNGRCLQLEARKLARSEGSSPLRNLASIDSIAAILARSAISPEMDMATAAEKGTRRCVINSSGSG